MIKKIKYCSKIYDLYRPNIFWNGNGNCWSGEYFHNGAYHVIRLSNSIDLESFNKMLCDMHKQGVMRCSSRPAHGFYNYHEVL